MSNTFIHLRTHTNYSLSEGMLTADYIANFCKDEKQPACAIISDSRLTFSGFALRIWCLTFNSSSNWEIISEEPSFSMILDIDFHYFRHRVMDVTGMWGNYDYAAIYVRGLPESCQRFARGLPEVARGCPRLPEVARGCPGLPGLSEVARGCPRFARDRTWVDHEATSSSSWWKTCSQLSFY